MVNTWKNIPKKDKKKDIWKEYKNQIKPPKIIYHKYNTINHIWNLYLAYCNDDNTYSIWVVDIFTSEIRYLDKLWKDENKALRFLKDHKDWTIGLFKSYWYTFYGDIVVE